jgi:hypothetical protein
MDCGQRSQFVFKYARHRVTLGIALGLVQTLSHFRVVDLPGDEEVYRAVDLAPVFVVLCQSLVLITELDVSVLNFDNRVPDFLLLV